MRITKKDLEQIEKVINGKLERNDSDRRVYIEWAYGRPRAYLVPADNPHVQERELSPRLPTGDLYRWLYAFDRGLNIGFELGKSALEKEDDNV